MKLPDPIDRPLTVRKRHRRSKAMTTRSTMMQKYQKAWGVSLNTACVRPWEEPPTSIASGRGVSSTPTLQELGRIEGTGLA
jgi:hypothetical protein